MQLSPALKGTNKRDVFEEFHAEGFAFHSGDRKRLLGNPEGGPV